MIKWLETWFEFQCDGDWEHEEGIKIETLDNPGWDITISLKDKDFLLIPWTFIEISKNNWIGYKVENNLFNASGSISHLNTLIKVFKIFIETKRLDKEKIINLL